MKNLACLMSMFALTAAPVAFAVDTAAPELGSVAIAPAAVDISAAGQQVTVTLALTDDESGLTYGNLSLYNPEGHFVKSAVFDSAQRTSGDALSGTYAVPVTVPLHSPPGTWRIGAWLGDGAGNTRNYGGDATAFPVPADATFTVVNTGQIDTSAPVLTASAVTPAAPATVNTGTAAQTVTVAFECTDDLVGLNYGWVYVWRPDGVFRQDLLQFFSASNRLSGDKMAGTYEVTVPLARNSAEGAWTMQIFMTDEVGNYQFTPISGFTVANIAEPVGTLATALDAVQLQWVSSTPGWDYQHAESHDGIDAAASQPLGDDEVGTLQTTVTGPGVLSFHWRVDSEEIADVLSVEVLGTAVHHEISGNTAWAEVSLAIPPGPQAVRWQYAKNATGAVGADRGWLDEVRFVAEADSGLPVLQALRISPNPVNVADGPQVVTFTLEITDDFLGLAEGNVNLYTPSGTWHDSVWLTASDRVGGSALAGTYEVTLEVPQGGEYGDWRVAVELIEVDTNLSRFYGEIDEPFPGPGEGLFTVWDGVSIDNNAPQIEDFAITPAEVDISGAAATVTVMVRITDSQEGFMDGNIDVTTSTGDWTGSVYFNAGARIAGDAFDGTYEINVPVPRYGPLGIWRLQCSISDTVGNRRDYPFGTGFPGGVEGTFTVVNDGDVDLLAPVVTAIGITPGVIDTSTAPTTIRVTVSISDDLSGIRDSQLFFYNPQGAYFGSLYASLDASNRISGDAVSATHEVDLMIPQGTATGTWTIRVFLRDTVGHTRFYGLDGAAYPEPGDGNFTVGTALLSTFKAFASVHNLTGNDALPSADPDHDGRPNAVELSQGTNPTLADPDAGWFTLSRDATHLHFDFTLAPALAVTVNGDHLELRDGGGGAPLRLSGQTQAGLAGPWTGVRPTLVAGTTWRISLALADGRGFARLAFEDP